MKLGILAVKFTISFAVVVIVVRIFVLVQVLVRMFIFFNRNTRRKLVVGRRVGGAVLGFDDVGCCFDGGVVRLIS